MRESQVENIGKMIKKNTKARDNEVGRTPKEGTHI
jgi:hypothetical protein